MNFAHPHILWFLLVLPPALLAFHWWAGRKRQKLLASFIQARLLPELTAGLSPARAQISAALLTAALALTIFALARPQWGFTWEESKQKGLDIIVAIDTSKSMLAEDIAPNRLARAKLAAIDLMQQAKSDRLGLVAFAGGAFLQCPMTIDDAAFRQSVESLDTETIPQGGTAIAEAIETALAAFKEGDNHKVLVLFTDGEDHDSNAVEAARKAGEAGLRIFTIGLGSTGGDRVPIHDAKGRVDFVRDENNNVIFSKLNESMLQEIARAGNGFYLPMRGAKVIETLYENGLAPLPKSESGAKLFKRYHERFHLPLAVAMLLLVVETLLPARWAKVNRGTNGMNGTDSAPVAKSAKSGAAVLLALLLVPMPVTASPSSAYRDYREGRFDKAQDEYQRLLQKKADDSRLALNAGAAAYRGGKFDDAETFFSQAAKAPDLKVQQQAYYNRGNSRFHAGDSLEDAEKKKAAWEGSLNDFDSAAKLNDQDADAKNNHEFVKKKLEELKQQQQQQNKDDKKQDQQDKKDQDKKDQQKKDDQKKSDEQKQNDQQSKQDDKQKQDQKDQKADPKQDQKKPDEQKQGQQPKPEKKDSKEPQEQQQANAAPQQPNQMTPEQAMRVLDTTKDDEKMLPVQLEKPPQSNKKLKDW